MKIAEYSNGHADVYKGKRDVKAGWMVIFPCGKFNTGHSLDKVKAEKTARAHASSCAGYYFSSGNSLWHHQEAIKAGFKSIKAYRNHLKQKRAEFVAQCNFEYVEITES